MIGARRLSCAFILVALPAVLFVAVPASAQSWPSRAAKLILTLGPGSGADMPTGRMPKKSDLLQEALSLHRRGP